MTRIERYGCVDWEDFLETVMTCDLIYTNAKGEEYIYYTEGGGIGQELYDYENKVLYEYETVEDMLNQFVYPDVYNGENYQFDD